MSEKRNEKLVETTENKKMTSNQIKQQLMNLTNSSKHRLQRLNVKNKLKINHIKHKFNRLGIESGNSVSPIINEAKPSDLRILNRFTNIFSGVVIIGLSAGLLYTARPVVTAETFTDKMQDSIEAAFSYAGSDINMKNGTIAYHIPRQFKYRWSIGVNDIMDYKGNEVVMYYNHQYHAIGQDTETYYLLRDENKAAGEEVFYRDFNENGQNGFVQLVQLPEKYLLTVFVDGAKLSTIINYEEAPYVAYNMLVVGRTVESYGPTDDQTQLASGKIEVEGADSQETEELANTQDKPQDETQVKDETNQEIQKHHIDSTGKEVTSDNDDSSTNENEQIIQFDFSSDKRSELIQSENEQ